MKIQIGEKIVAAYKNTYTLEDKLGHVYFSGHEESLINFKNTTHIGNLKAYYYDSNGVKYKVDFL